ncbi:hypothetical protein [Streptomyces sp. NPDC017949]|uniref:hypothetical protein n=1 Tax=Streptomyces sp. NPDC017949 TaxID=3365020 RepID=UPI0037BC2557
MTKAREIMTADATCIGAQETVLEAAKKMTQLGVGALPDAKVGDLLQAVSQD